MSSAAPPRPTSPSPARSAPPPTGGGATIDPIKVLKKWKYVLMVAVVVGMVVGVIGHYVWMYTYPLYVSGVTYEASPPENPDLLEASNVDEDAMERFMATQADRMMSPIILESVARDPRLQQEAADWSKRYMQSDGLFDYQEAMQDLEDMASAHPVKGTNYVRLRVMWKKPVDVAAIARLLSEAYIKDLQQGRVLENNQRRDAIQRAINDFKKQIDNLSERRARLIRDKEVTGIVEQATTTREKLSLIARERNNVALEMRSIEVQLNQMNKMVESEGGIRYSDTQRAMAENSPIVQQMKQTKELLEARLKELRRSGFLPEHREYKKVERQIQATEQQITVTMERELARIFDSEKDALEMQLRQYQAQDADMASREEELSLTLQDLTRTIREINDISDEIKELNGALADRRRALQDIETTTSLDSASRMQVVESARVPDKPMMPVIYIMIPLGALVVTGLVGGAILAAEFLDQRVKSPSDLASMPGVKILGTVPLAEEAPTATGPFETVFRDADRSVVAEHFRQIRTILLKKLDEGGHKTCLFVSCMPGSGSTSVATNLALACAGVDRRVLLIDANFRRPALHRLLGLRERPGLGDVLAGEATDDSAIQSVSGGSLEVMAVGAPEHRVFERLGTQPMTELLARLTTRYDFIFIDTAPAVVSGDAFALAQRCDTAVLITRAMAEKRGMVGRIKNELNDTPAELLGLIVNGVRSAAGGYLKRNIRTSAAYHAPQDPDGIISEKKDQAKQKGRGAA